MRRTPITSTRAAVLAASLLIAACGTAAPGTPSPGTPSPDQAVNDIEAMLHDSAEAWTRADLDGFLDDYAADATYVGSAGLIRGRERIRQSYVRGYWSSGEPADGLRFRDLEVRTVGTDAAVAVGRYELFDRDTGASTATGLFSLTLRSVGDEWKIVHDHSSADGSE